ncbi:MAG: nitroreductase family protein [Brachyspira sp.]|jgi:nitroreductase|nr:nitroreductase family protein [Brachyspira sp.]
MDNIIFKRRSIRRFETRPVEPEKVERILKAGMQAPSAHNLQPWEFLVITEQEKRDAVSKMSPWACMVAKAPVTIIVIGHQENKDMEKYLPQDLGACTENILLQIAAEGLGGCWMGFYPDEDRVNSVRKYFNLPEDRIPFSVIALGYSPDENRFVDRSDMSRVHYNRW